MKNSRLAKRERARYKDSITPQVDQIYGAAVLSLHREWGWGEKRAHDLLEGVLKTWNECADQFYVSALMMLEDETGIELKPTPNSRSYHEIPCLNGVTMLGRDMTPGQYLYYRQQLISWAPTQMLAILFLTLHRQHGFSDRRLTRLLEQMEQYKKLKPKEITAAVKEELHIDLEHYTEGKA